MPLLIKQIVSHPYFWMGVFFLLAIWLRNKRKKRLSITFFITAFLFLLVSTPVGSVWLLNQADAFYPEPFVNCDQNQIRDTILLPGGVYKDKNVERLSHWSIERAKLAIALEKNQLTNLVIIPGGYRDEGEKLGHYLLSKDSNTNFTIGVGSANTYENFIEIKHKLDADKEYWLVTSRWHYPRAARIANKLGINVCPMVTQPLVAKGFLYHRDAHWQGKIAIHEMLATFLYYVLGRI